MTTMLLAQPGALPEPALEQLIAKARELDMDEVHRSIAEHQEMTSSASRSHFLRALCTTLKHSSISPVIIPSSLIST